MEESELRGAWSELERRLAAQGERERAVPRSELFGPARRALRRHGAPVFLELAAAALALYLLGSFLREHFALPRFAVPACVLFVAALASFGANAALLAARLRVDRSEVVLAVQRRIAELRVVRARVAHWTLLSLPLLWTPFAIVAAVLWLELDLYAELGPTVVAVNLSAGLAVIPLGISAARLCADRLAHAPRCQLVADTVAGNGLVRALELQAELEAFAGDD